MSSKKVSIIIAGPTGSGKTSLSLKLAEKIDAEIISADSMQVYKEFNIITAKPSFSEMDKIPHHLIGSMDLSCDFDVAIYAKNVKEIVSDLYAKNKYPLIVGGTGMYIMSLTDGIFEGGDIKEDIQKEMDAVLASQGSCVLHEKLKKYDAKAALKIHPNDAKRITRALGVTLSAGVPFSTLQENKTPVIDQFLFYGIEHKREVLYDRINKRVDKMFEAGAVFEVENILKNDKKISKSAAQALGFKEIAGYIKGEYDKERAVYLLKKNTRNFAKRQLTWFRRDKRIKWLNLGKDNTNADKICIDIIKDLEQIG